MTLTEREKCHILPILDRAARRAPWSYDILPLNYIHALAAPGGGSLDYLGDRLPLLCRPPNRYLRRPLTQLYNHKANSRFQVFAHADRALGEDEFWHDLMANMVMAQIEIGVRRDRELQIANFARILAAPTMPKDSPAGTSIEVAMPGQKPVRAVPDWQPFGIGKGKLFRFYFGIEADKSSEPLRTTRVRQSISAKFKRYLEIDAQQLPRKLYGLPHFYYPFVTSNPARVGSMIELLLELTRGKGHPRFLFASFPTYNSFETPPPPDGALLRAPWKRAGYPDLRMDEL